MRCILGCQMTAKAAPQAFHFSWPYKQRILSAFLAYHIVGPQWIALLLWYPLRHVRILLCANAAGCPAR
jgi:hypothetical protein